MHLCFCSSSIDLSHYLLQKVKSSKGERKRNGKIEKNSEKGKKEEGERGKKRRKRDNPVIERIL